MPSSAPPTPGHSVTVADVFTFAGPLQKFVIVLLLAAAVAAMAVVLVKLSRGERLPGGSAFLSGLRLGGPIVGGLGACFSLLMMTLGYANAPGNLPLKVLAPGFAEAFLQVGAGFLTGSIAVFCNWVVESRIDRQALGV